MPPPRKYPVTVVFGWRRAVAFRYRGSARYAPRPGAAPRQTSTPQSIALDVAVRASALTLVPHNSGLASTARTTNWQLRAALWPGLGAPGGIRTCATRFRKIGQVIDSWRHQASLVAHGFALTAPDVASDRRFIPRTIPSGWRPWLGGVGCGRSAVPGS